MKRVSKKVFENSMSLLSMERQKLTDYKARKDNRSVSLNKEVVPKLNAFS